MRLLQVLNTYELWDETIALAGTPYLEPTADFNEQIKRSRQLGRAYFRTGKNEQGKELLASLEKQLVEQRAAQEKAGVAARSKLTGKKPEAKKPEAKKPEAKKPEAKKPEAKKPEAKKPEAKKKKVDKKAIKKAVDAARKAFDSKIRVLDKAVQELQAHVLLADGSEEKAKEALALFKKAGGMDVAFLASVQLATGDGDGAEKALRDQVKRRVNEVQPQAHLVELLWKRGRKKQAVEELKSLRKLSGSIDLTAPVFGRLAPVAKKADFPEDWRLEAVVRKDTGDRPKLDDLGPFRWKPQVAADWSLPADGGRNVALKDYRGKPVVVIFYLGYGCLHCVEQLQAFAPKAEAFRKAGIELVAISSDSQEDLAKSIEKFNKEGEFPFPLAADPKFEIFKKYRCFDDFEKLTLHGTFLIDGDGLVRWQDISYDPFMDVEFLLKESQRLLGQTARRQVAKGGE